MRRGWIAGGLVAAVVLAGVWLPRGKGTDQADAADAKEKRSIHTSGTAMVRVKPDSARVFFGVETMAPGVKDARADSEKRVKAVLDALHGLKIPNLRMKTADVTVSLEKTHRREDRLPEILGYKVTHTFTVLIQDADVDKLGATARRVLDTALEHGANIVEHISFFRQDDKEARREALAKAVEDALANAKALAGGAKVQLRDPITIHGQPDYSSGRYNDNRSQNVMAQPGGDGATMVAGDLVVTCSVSVTCSY